MYILLQRKSGKWSTLFTNPDLLTVRKDMERLVGAVSGPTNRVLKATEKSVTLEDRFLTIKEITG